MPEKWIRNGEDRVPIYVLAMNEDRVLYQYNYANRNSIGCVSRGFFDANYSRLDT